MKPQPKPTQQQAVFNHKAAALVEFLKSNSETAEGIVITVLPVAEDNGCSSSQVLLMINTCHHKVEALANSIYKSLKDDPVMMGAFLSTFLAASLGVGMKTEDTRAKH